MLVVAGHGVSAGRSHRDATGAKEGGDPPAGGPGSACYEDSSHEPILHIVRSRRYRLDLSD
ncbi:hypothetical protein GCM10018952_17670 [Streptosporangium vulgare]